MRKKDNLNGSPSFWTTIPGMLTGVAAVITAVAGLIAVFVNAGFFKPVAPGSNTSTGPPAVDQASVLVSGDCFAQFFSGVLQDRLSTIEAGALDVQLIGPHQVTAPVIGVKFTDFNQPVGAVKFQFFRDNQIFKIQSLVDSKCQTIETYQNASRGGDKRVLQNWDDLQMRFAEQDYSLRVGYDSGQMGAVFRKVSR